MKTISELLFSECTTPLIRFISLRAIIFRQGRQDDTIIIPVIERRLGIDERNTLAISSRLVASKYDR